MQLLDKGLPPSLASSPGPNLFTLTKEQRPSAGYRYVVGRLLNKPNRRKTPPSPKRLFFKPIRSRHPD